MADFSLELVFKTKSPQRASNSSVSVEKLGPIAV